MKNGSSACQDLALTGKPDPLSELIRFQLKASEAQLCTGRMHAGAKGGDGSITENFGAGQHQDLSLQTTLLVLATTK